MAATEVATERTVAEEGRESHENGISLGVYLMVKLRGLFGFEESF